MRRRSCEKGKTNSTSPRPAPHAHSPPLSTPLTHTHSRLADARDAAALANLLKVAGKAGRREEVAAEAAAAAAARRAARRAAAASAALAAADAQATADRAAAAAAAVEGQLTAATADRAGLVGRLKGLLVQK